MDEQERKDFAAEVAKAAKEIKRPWWMSWGIPSAAIAGICALITVIYNKIDVAVDQNTAINATQNESLAATAAILTSVQAELIRQNEAIEHSRVDPWTGTDAEKAQQVTNRRIDRLEIKTDNLEKNQHALYIQSAETALQLKTLANTNPQK